MTTVKPGQIWADNDPRSAGRTLRVDAIEGERAVCTVLTNDTDTQTALDGGVNILGYKPKDTRGKTTRISVARFQPTRTGYRLIQDQQYGVRWPTGVVMACSSRQAAEDSIALEGRGVLVVHEYEPGTSNSTEWREA